MNKQLKKTFKFIAILALYFSLLFLVDMGVNLITPDSFWAKHSTDWIIIRGIAKTFIFICAGTFVFMLIYIINMGVEAWREGKEERKNNNEKI